MTLYYDITGQLINRLSIEITVTHTYIKRVKRARERESEMEGEQTFTTAV